MLKTYFNLIKIHEKMLAAKRKTINNFQNTIPDSTGNILLYTN